MYEQDETPEDYKNSTMKDLNLDNTQDEETPQQILNRSRLTSEGAIPVPPSIGELFEVRARQGKKVSDKYRKDWLSSIKYFRGEAQTPDENDEIDFPQENMVRTTVETLVDFTYMRNPDVEITALNKNSQPMEKILTAAIKGLVNKRGAKALNLRQKMLKTIVYSHLTNFGILKLEFQENNGSLEEAQAVFRAAQQKISEAKDTEEAAPYYDMLDVIHKEMAERAPFGIGVKSISPFNILVDAECQNSDFSDSQWLMEFDNMKIGHIKSEYMQFDEETEQYHFRYDPSMTFEEKQNDVNSTVSIAEQTINEIMPDLDEDQKKVISEDTIPVVWVWDRATNLKYLYIKDRWDTPLWVFENRMNLSRFFPYFMLPFSTPLTSVYQRSEVSHYLPFQYEVNEINRQMSMYRRIAFSLFLYDSASIDSAEINKLITEAKRKTREMRALGVKLRDKDKSLSEALEPFRMPAVQFKEAFDKSDLKDSVQRQTRISEALKGVEFRTNTTNDAIQTYNNFAQTRLDSLTDRIEQVTEELFWSICEIIVSKYDQNSITNLVTEELAEQFTPMDVEEFNDQFSLVVAAGSTEKPTSQAKKQEAVGIIQMLGQFGSAAPQTTLTIVSRLLRSAFSRTLVTDEDLETLQQEGQANLQKGISQTQGAQPQAAQPAQPSQEPQ